MTLNTDKENIKEQMERCNHELCNEVVERRLAEQRLHEQERHQRDIFYNISDSISLVEVTEDGRFRYLETNRAFTTAIGVSEDSLRGQYVDDLLRALNKNALAEELLAELCDCLADGSVIEKEITLDFPSGRRIYNSKMTPLFDDSGRINRILCVAHDITAIKQTEALLVQREREYRSLTENLPDNISRYNRDGVKVYVNPALERTLGAQASAMLGTTPREYHPDGSFEDYAQLLDTVLASGEAGEFEKIQPDPLGETCIHQIRMVPERDEKGEMVGVLAIGRDITERKATEEALRVSEERMRLFFERQLVGMAITSPEKGWLKANDRICEMFGYTHEELAQMTWAQLTYPDDLPDDVAQFERMLNGEIDSYSMEKRFLHKDGHIVFVDLSVGCVRCSNGSVDYVLALLADITERKRMEMEHLNHLRFFESMDKVNRALQGSNDLETVLNNVLDTVLAIFDCDRAFLCHPCDPNADSWSVPFEKTKPEFPGAQAFGMAIPMDADIAKTFRLLLDTDGPVTQGAGNQHPLPKEVSETFGIKSHMAVAVYPKGDKPWRFGIHQCSRPRVWTDDEQKLFQEIARRLADALTSLQAYRDIQEREQKFRTLADSMPDIVAAYDLQLRKIYANQNLEQILAVDIDGTWLGKTPKELYPDGELDEYQTRLEEIINTGTCDDWIWKKPNKQGVFFFYQTRFAALRDSDGKIIGELAITRDVTKSRQMELELIRSEREFRTLAENMPDILIRYDREGRRTYVNPALVRNYAVRVEQMIGLMQQESNPFHMPETYRLALEHTLATGERNELELQIPTSSGDMRSNLVFIAAERAADGQILGAITIGHDITERKQAEALLVQREREFRTLAENLPDRIGRYDLQARLIYANPCLQRSLGCSAQQLLGKTPKERDPGGRYDRFQAKLEEVISTGQSEEMEVILPDNGEGLQYFHIHFVPEFSPNGEMIGALAIGRDVTKKRQLELELIRSEREFRTLAENSPDSIIRYDRNCRRTYVNPAYEIATNTQRADIVGKTPLEDWHLATPNAAEYTKLLQRVMATGKAERVEVQLFDTGGNPHYFSMQFVPEYDEHEQVNGVLSFATDITELKTAEQRRVEAREDERKSLARELHDDLGQRLLALRIDIYRLKQQLEKDKPELLAQIQKIEAAGNATSQIVGNIAAMLRPTALDLGLVSALTWLADEFCKRTGVECQLQLPKQNIVLNESQSMAIFRIVQESLTNITKYAQASQVKIALTHSDSGYVLEICDDGKGFVPDAAKKAGSFGLKGIGERVQMLGGTLTVETAPGCGVKLTANIPTAR